MTTEEKELIKATKEFAKEYSVKWDEVIESMILNSFRAGKHSANTLVVGQREQYHCELYDFGRKDKPCDKQCDSCKSMNID